jgi:hypothetical protein
MGGTFLGVQIIFEKTTQLLSKVYLIKMSLKIVHIDSFVYFGIVDLELGFLSRGTGSIRFHCYYYVRHTSY